jgi:hypothetical protein
MSSQKKRIAKVRAAPKAVHPKESGVSALRHQVEETDRPDTPQLEGGIPLPEELTGRASGTSEDLTALFDNESKAHLADGFRGGSADDPSPLKPADDSEEPVEELE